MRREAQNHLNTLLSMIDALPIEPSPVEVGRLAGQAALFRIWYSPDYCEATVAQNCEDQWGQLCGKQCAPGHSLCPDHLSEVGQ